MFVFFSDMNYYTNQIWKLSTLWLACAWFLKIVSVRMLVCVHVCLRACVSAPEAINNYSDVIWTPYDWLHKLYKCYMAIVVGIINGYGLAIDTHHGN